MGPCSGDANPPALPGGRGRGPLPAHSAPWGAALFPWGVRVEKDLRGPERDQDPWGHPPGAQQLTRVEADKRGDTGGHKCNAQRPGEGLFIVEQLKLVHVGVPKKLPCHGALEPVGPDQCWGGDMHLWLRLSSGCPPQA